ncbi:hypothetical protein BDN70DRAFT_993960 [Pholiota conissans]|uniref:RNI-like protein n=1 Tax=Pholiota conissans TaxID=109636 RepID=A0A9P5Z0V6_9AGAR|nr:hypothetical protein BDN70DRAFT_993960 [Pholiota conissans]
MHFHLHDQGCREVFQWLISGDEVNLPGARFPKSLDFIKLSDVHMGDTGFRALVDWLESLRPLHDERPLTSINVGPNDIVGTADLAEDFVAALSFSSTSSYSTSSLCHLVLTNNPLSPSFRTTLISLLSSLPTLQTLNLSMTGLDKDNAFALANYVGNKIQPCKLKELHASGNLMGYRGVRAIVEAVNHCQTMEKVTLYANNAAAIGIVETSESSDEDAALLSVYGTVSRNYPPDSGCGWRGLERKLKYCISLNLCMKHTTIHEALLLIRYSRMMLRKKVTPPSIRPKASCDDCECLARQPDMNVDHDVPVTSSSDSFSFSNLPMEIQLHILSLLAPLLSTAQRLRIFDYAVDRSTLPSLRLCLPDLSKVCIPDPGHLAFDSASTGIRDRVGKRVGSLAKLRESHSCSGTTCNASRNIICQRQTMRDEFLARVKCDQYDPDL